MNDRQAVMPEVESFFDPQTSAFSYLLHSGNGSACAVIDPVLGYDPDSELLDTAPADALLRVIEARRLQVQWILETHIHADHLTAAAYLRSLVGGRIAAGIGVAEVQAGFQISLGLAKDYCQAHGQFDHLFAADETFAIGPLRVCALQIPGHTPADTAFVVNDHLVFVGDSLFQPDVGTARCDFPGGSAAQLYHSIQRLLQLPADTRLFMCHDYPAQRAPLAVSTVAEQRAGNRHVHDGVSEAQFVTWREQRDSSLAPPRLLQSAILWNLRAGNVPPGELAERYRWRSKQP